MVWVDPTTDWRLGSSDPRASARALAAFGAVACGMAASRALAGNMDPPPLAWFSLAVIAAGAAMVRWRLILLWISLAAISAGWFGVRITHAPRSALAPMLASSGASHAGVPGVILGVVERDPEPVGLTERELAWSFPVAARALEGPPDLPLKGRVWALVTDATAAPPWRAGDAVRITGLLAPIDGPSNPGQRDARAWAAQEGVIARVRAPTWDLVTPWPRDAGPLDQMSAAWLRWRADLRARSRALLGADARASNPPTFDDRARAMLASLIVGAREPGLDDVSETFTRLGLAHVMAISGFHLVVLAGVALLGIRLVGDLGRLESVLLAALVVAYVILVPPNAPVIRSACMLLAFLAGDALGRRHDRIAVLAWTGVVVAAWRPLELWSLGFQLSFALVGALIWLAEHAESRLFGERVRGLPVRRPSTLVSLVMRAWDLTRPAARAAISASVLCWLIATPIALYHTGLVSLAGVPASVIVVPVSVVVMWAAFGALVFGLAAPPMGEACSAALELLSRALLGLVEALDRIPGASVTLPPVSLAWALAGVGGAVYLLARGRLRSWPTWTVAGGIALWLAVECAVSPRAASNDLLRIDTLSVGDGTCHIVRSRGQALVWDCGSSSVASLDRLLRPAMRELGVHRAKALVVTHADLDHYSSVVRAVDQLGVREVMVGAALLDAARTTPGVRDLLEALSLRRVTVRPVRIGDSVAFGDAHLEFLGPSRDHASDNDDSLVGLVTVHARTGVRRALFTGDIERAGVEDLLVARPNLRAEVMEVPHHGAPAEWTLRLLAQVDPVVAIQSTGPSRANDPRWDWARENRTWLTTATDGATWATIDANGRVRAGGMRR